MKIRDLNQNDRIIIWQYKGMDIDEGQSATVVGLSYKNFSQDTAIVQLDEVPHKIELTDTDYFDRLPISNKKSKDYECSEENESVKQPPSHYKGTGDIDLIEFCRQQFTPEMFRGAMMFTIMRYGTRLGRKDEKVKELNKIIDYAERYKEVLEDEQ